MRRILTNTMKVVLPILLGCGILYWMYRDFNFERIGHTLIHETNWWWMSFSLLFGILAQVFRGTRWRLALDPLGEHPAVSTCIHAIFLSYTTSLIIPRSGEVTRCAILSKYEGTSFPKAIGTVVSERIIDTLIILIMSLVVFACQIKTFMRFFDETGTNFTDWLNSFSTTGYVVTTVCIIAIIILLWYLMRNLNISIHVKKFVGDIKHGVFSLKDVRCKWLFIAYTLGIWISYFLHFYITFFCFDYTSSLTVSTALIAFIVGSFAVIVPTPNGMGSWHFAVKTILVLSGVRSAVDAETYVLIVHAIQTALMPLLGIYSVSCLLLRKKKKTNLST